MVTESPCSAAAGPKPCTVSGRSSRFRIVARISEPSGTRITGPGVDSALPASANAATSSARPLSPSGRHTPDRASSATVSTPCASLPAGRRLSLGAMRSGPGGCASAVVSEPSAMSAAQAVDLDMAASLACGELEVWRRWGQDEPVYGGWPVCGFAARRRARLCVGPSGSSASSTSPLPRKPTLGAPATYTASGNSAAQVTLSWPCGSYYVLLGQHWGLPR